MPPTKFQLNPTYGKGVREQHYLSMHLLSVHLSVMLSPPKPLGGIQPNCYITTPHGWGVREQHYFSVCLSVLKVSRKYLKQFSSYRVDTYTLQKSLFSKFKGPLLQKQVNQSLPFLCSAPRLMMLYTCVKFHQNIWDGLQLIEQT